MVSKKKEVVVQQIDEDDMESPEDESESDYIEEGKQDRVERKQPPVRQDVAVIVSQRLLPDGSFETIFNSNFVIGTFGKVYPKFNLE